ncbi:MAG: hypothetical protein HKN76_19125 [Saprospiraceae bacterium]|nr:hypothetical protein [Saprospiraceae bacterium]
MHKNPSNLCLLAALFITWAVSTDLRGSSISEHQAMAQEIYAKLQEAVGDKKSVWPKLIVWSVENRGAVFVPADNSIYLDEKVIKSCVAFGDQMKDALSFVIAHEMTHFYQNHQWKESGLVRNFMVSSAVFEANRHHEAQADIYGAFVSYQAGFNTLALIPDLLDRIYASYGLDSAANGQYPSLETRKDLALEACDLASNLIEIYQTANYLLVLGKFESAYPLYKHVAQSIQFKELHYNLGLCNMMAYMHLQKMDLKYPLALDSRSPIQRGLIDRSPQLLLDDAKESFDLITEQYDAQYSPAKIHLISIYDWLGEQHKAEALISLCAADPEINQNHIYRITEANYYARQGQLVKSRDIYQSLLGEQMPDSNYIREIINHNLASAQNRKPPASAMRSQLIRNEKDLDDVSSLVFYRDFQQTLHIGSGLQFQYAHEYNSSVSKLDFGKVKFSMQRITHASIKSSHGLGIGNSLGEIENRIGNIDLAYARHVNGMYVINYNQGLIFKLNPNGIIEEWVSFSI